MPPFLADSQASEGCEMRSRQDAVALPPNLSTG